MPWIAAAPATSPTANRWGGTYVTILAQVYYFWDGTSRVPANLLGYWDGTAIQSVKVLGYWDGVSVQPVSPT